MVRTTRQQPQNPHLPGLPPINISLCLYREGPAKRQLRFLVIRMSRDIPAFFPASPRFSLTTIESPISYKLGTGLPAVKYYLLMNIILTT
jgi:hypothetical protein